MLRGLDSCASDPRLLVGADSFDDAGAFLLRDGLVLLQTADIISPVCDDPELFGRIAAANALSDVYAMGGEPCTVLNLAFFPARMPLEVQRGVLAGAQETCREAGALVVGGHTLDADEVKFGLSVSGTCTPDQLLRNAGARPGDRLVLTKPIGTGLVLTGLRKGWVSEEELAGSLAQMAQLNSVAAREARVAGAHGATDVTGFGLGGHAAEMARASGVAMRLQMGEIPRYPRADEMLGRGAKTVITDDNLSSMRTILAVESTATAAELLLLADAQTSGGLLVSVPAAEAERYVERLHNSGVVDAALIGDVAESDAPILVIESA